MRAACGIGCAAQRAEALSRAFAAEMGTGAHVIADGWVLAPSEARIAALWYDAGRPAPA